MALRYKPNFFISMATAEGYRDIIQRFIALLEIEIRIADFNKTGAPAHMAAETLSFLANFFHKRIISDGYWPARSPNLDFFPCRYLINCVLNQ